MELKKKLKADEESIRNKKERDTDKSYPISMSIDENINKLLNDLGNSEDIKIRQFKIGKMAQIRAFICFIEGMENKQPIEHIIKALYRSEDIKNTADGDLVTLIKEHVASVSIVSEGASMNKAMDAILNGSSVLFVDRYDRVLIFETRNFKTRGIQEPDTEQQIRGPREGFIEDLRVNCTLLRRKIRNANLVFETFNLGKQTHTTIRIAYIKGIANEKIINEVKKRLNSINVDSILESGYVEQFIEDHPFSPFPTIGNSEKPDKIAAKLLEGRVAILCDGTPSVLTVPFLFIENIQVGDDYYNRPVLVSFVRSLRVIAYFSTMLIPALYIAVSTFHPEMLPTQLLIKTAASREGVPFPAVVETLIMMIMFEILRETGLRLPKMLGPSLSIVGVLILGEIAVRAGIVGTTMVIIGAFTGLTSLIITPLVDSGILLRFILIIASGVLGMYGIVLVLIILAAHLCSLSSFGVPYMAPVAPLIWRDLKDSIVRLPLWMMNLRPKSTIPQNVKRQDVNLSDYLDKPSRGDKK